MKWQTELNAGKCKVLQAGKKTNPRHTSALLNSELAMSAREGDLETRNLRTGIIKVTKNVRKLQKC